MSEQQQRLDCVGETIRLGYRSFAGLRWVVDAHSVGEDDRVLWGHAGVQSACSLAR